MNRTLFVKRYLLPLLLISIPTLVGITSNTAVSSTRATLAEEIEVTLLDPTNTSSHEVINCRPDTGWTWTTGSFQPEIESQVQQTLRKMGIGSSVQAKGFGETDSCGAFRLYAVDFAVDVRDQNLVDDFDHQELADHIYSALIDFGKPRLGRVIITFPQGDTFYFQGEVGNLNSPSPQRETMVTPLYNAQVDATLPWQDTGISIDANEMINLEVISGLWTHQVGVAPYNNGIGGSYICTDYLPPEICVEPMPEVPQGALIGKIGSHRFAIGSGTTITAQQSGNLYLRINDAGLYDNDGILTVKITTRLTQGELLPRKVYVVVYDPLLSNGQLLSERLNWLQHASLTQGTIDFFHRVSGGRLVYKVVDTKIVTDGWPEKVDGFRYTEAQYLNVINGNVSPHWPDAVNYNKIVNDINLDICGRANRGEIDEVWIYNGPYFGFYESTLVGPNAYWYNSPPVPGPHNCNRLIPIMGPSPERGLESAIHNFGHRTESTMERVYGSWQRNRTTHNWERFTLVKALSPSYSYSGCGSIHYPPNGTSDYDYGNTSTVMSNCGDFANYPNLSDPTAVLQPVTCSIWNCSELGYFSFWFSHLPSNPGCGPDNVANNWWLYFAEPAHALNPSSACQALIPALTINFTTGQPGSFFTITGINFPRNSTATISINGVSIATTVNTDSFGNLTFILDTSNANVGRYFVTVTVNPSVTTSFELDLTQPLRPQSGSGMVVIVPSGVGFTESVYSPLVQK